MMHAADSFIKYLSTVLAGDPPVRWVRVTTDDEQSNEMKLDELNVSILSWSEDGALEEILISLDIAGADERAVHRVVERVRDALLQRQFTFEYDYSTTPGQRVALGKAVTWDGDFEFSLVQADPQLVHYNATFALRHAR